MMDKCNKEMLRQAQQQVYNDVNRCQLLSLAQKQHSLKLIRNALASLERTGLTLITSLEPAVLCSISTAILALLKPQELWRPNAITFISRLLDFKANPCTTLVHSFERTGVLAAVVEQVSREPPRHRKQCRALVRKLLRCGADPNVLNIFVGVERTVFCHHVGDASSTPDYQTTALLLRYGANPKRCCRPRGGVWCPVFHALDIPEGWPHCALLLLSGAGAGTAWEDGIRATVLARLPSTMTALRPAPQHGVSMPEHNHISTRRRLRRQNIGMLVARVRSTSIVAVMCMLRRGLHHDVSLEVLRRVEARHALWVALPSEMSLAEENHVLV